MGAALYHGLIRRDDVLPSMTVGVDENDVELAKPVQISAVMGVKTQPLPPQNPRPGG
jgi:hypothetical protein